MQAPSRLGPPRSAAGILGVLFRGQTYNTLLYLAVAFPVAVLYGSILATGFLFGLVVTIVGVGLALLVGVVVLARWVAGFERWLANALLNVELTPADDVGPTETNGPLSSVRAYLDAPSTWRGLGFLSLKLWVGTVGVVLLVFLGQAIQLVAAPLRYPYAIEVGEINGNPVELTVGTLPESVLAAVVGIVLCVLLAHILNAVARVVGRTASALLDGSAPSLRQTRHRIETRVALTHVVGGSTLTAPAAAGPRVTSVFSAWASGCVLWVSSWPRLLGFLSGSRLDCRRDGLKKAGSIAGVSD